MFEGENVFFYVLPIHLNGDLCSSPGIALLYLQLHSVFRDASLLHKALEHVSRSLKCLTRRRDVTFLCGDAGPLAVAAIVYHRLQKPHEADECINRSEFGFLVPDGGK